MSKCVYCNNDIPVEGNKYRLEVKGETLKEMNLCSKECYKDMQGFISKRDKYQSILFIVLAVLLIANLLLLGIYPNSNYNYIPLGLMGVAIMVAPYMHVRYRSYVGKGVLKTLLTLRVLGAIIAVVSVVFFVYS